jgi:hypothetical protein
VGRPTVFPGGPDFEEALGDRGLVPGGRGLRGDDRGYVGVHFVSCRIVFIFACVDSLFRSKISFKRCEVSKKSEPRIRTAVKDSMSVEPMK